MRECLGVTQLLEIQKFVNQYNKLIFADNFQNNAIY
jgi:hypothetical protein